MVNALSRPARAAWRRPRRLRSRILARSYSAITPLDLQQQVVLGRAADRAVEEDDLDAGAAELLHQQHLVGIAAGQPVGGVDVERSMRPGRHGVAQPLQRRAQQAGAAVALVDVGVVGLELPAIGGDALAQRGDLAGDGVVARLLLGRDARVESDMTQPCSPPRRVTAAVGLATVVPGSGATVLRRIGTRRA